MYSNRRCPLTCHIANNDFILILTAVLGMADESANFSTDSSSASAYNNGPNITGTPSNGKSETDGSFYALLMIRQNFMNILYPIFV